jgi:2-polyprenyl-3-methyl-5-hydroxy-6-metoxy-1,4-benzoquinol methylase
VINWIQLWNDLVNLREWRYQQPDSPEQHDRWKTRAHDFDSHVRRRWARRDSTRTFLISLVQSIPHSTVLDIGAGTGKWAILLAPYAERITAVEPSSAMIEKMRDNLADSQVSNVDIVQSLWQDVLVEKHDVALCSHAMYGINDFAQFISKMQATTRHTCALLLRAPTMDGVMAEAAMKIWGHPYDSPNYHIALNALLQMGIFPNVLMEEPASWEPWAHASLEDAFAEIKQRFRLGDNTEHDEYLRDLLQRRLTYQDGRYMWPQGMRTALIFWRVDDTVSPHLDYLAFLRDNRNSPTQD